MKPRLRAIDAVLCLLALAPAATLAAAPECDRACLQSIAEAYLTAVPTHDPHKAPLSPEARYTENGVELTLPDGLWRTATGIRPYRLYVIEPELGEVGVYSRMQENGAPVLVATQLQVVDRHITRIESIVARSSDSLGGGSGTTPRPDVLGDAPRPQFLQELPPDSRRSRQDLIDIVNTYFTGIENNTGAKPPLFADDCNRIEDGSYTTNRPVVPHAEPNGANYPCKQAFALGYYHDDTRLRDRRVLVVDRERGLVYTGMAIDHDATIRSYKLTNGQPMTVKRTAPWTWLAHEVFQIDKTGHISQVEAILLSVPYGMRPGWNTGTPLASPAAIRDHFRE